MYMQELQANGAFIERWFEKITLSNGQSYMHVQYRNEGLAPGRTIGDKQWKEKSHLPIFTYHELSQEELDSGMVVSATDGISVLSPQDIITALNAPDSQDNPATRIVKAAWNAGSNDNILRPLRNVVTPV